MTLFNDVVKLSLVEREAAPDEIDDAAAATTSTPAATAAGRAATAATKRDKTTEGRLYHKLRWKRPIHVGRTIGPLYAHVAVIVKSHMYIVGKFVVDEIMKKKEKKEKNKAGYQT